MKTGNAIASIATPIARMIGADCIDPATNDLRPESPCAKAKRRLNNGENPFTVMYDRFFSSTKGEVMKFRIMVEVEAERSSAIDQKKIEDSCGGEILAINPVAAPPQRPPQSPALAARPSGTPVATAG
jgi:hypothetical protein